MNAWPVLVVALVQVFNCLHADGLQLRSAASAQFHQTEEEHQDLHQTWESEDSQTGKMIRAWSCNRMEVSADLELIYFSFIVLQQCQRPVYRSATDLCCVETRNPDA